MGSGTNWDYWSSYRAFAGAKPGSVVLFNQTKRAYRLDLKTGNLIPLTTNVENAGAILGLRWNDVDEQAVRLADSKNGEPRTFPLRGGVADVIKRRKAARDYETSEGQAKSEWVFHVGGFRLWDFDYTWRKATKAADLPTRLFHDYRRTAVRDLVRSGVSQAVAMAWTGHKTDDVFRRYNVTATEDLELAADRLAEYRDARAKAIIDKTADVVVH